MSNVDMVRAAHEAFSSKDYDGALALLAPDGVLVDHGRGETIVGRDALRSWLTAFHDFASDMKLVEAVYLDGGAHVTAMFKAVGTQDGPLASFPASGKPFSLDICEVWTFAGGDGATEAHNYSDGLGMMIQLGHIPPPG